VGNSVEDAWRGLLECRNGIAPITRFDTTGGRCTLAGQVRDFNIEDYLDAKTASRLDQYCHFAIGAADQALKQANLGDSTPPERIGVIVSSGIGGIGTTCQQSNILDTRGMGRVSPLCVPMLISNMASGFLAITHNLRGPNFGLVSACATGLHSIGEASWIIKRGDADVMVAGGTETGVVPLSIAGFGSMRALSPNPDPETASRPFDKNRDGFIPAEGSAVIVLESEEHAKQRGAEILGELVGYGASCDAYHITAPRPDGSGAAAAIGMALRHAEINPEDIGYVNAHGTSTPMNDSIETTALKLAFGEHARKLAISSIKALTGHMLGAAGAFESIVCLQALRTGILPPTAHYQTPDPDCDLDYIPNIPREIGVNYALNVSLGFGGHNAAVIFRKY
jgi:3-oxoacyl-[acyl-carrier-protein] synthase II